MSGCIIPNKCLPANHNSSFHIMVCSELYQTNACPQTTTPPSPVKTSPHYTKQMPARKPQLLCPHGYLIAIIPNKCLPANHNDVCNIGRFSIIPNKCLPANHNKNSGISYWAAIIPNKCLPANHNYRDLKADEYKK